MKKLFLLSCLLCLGFPDAHAQDRWATRTGEVRINASTPLEDIDATNHRVNAIFRPADGAFAVVMLIPEFQFRRKLMQEHFNENYMESDKFPKATFSGEVSGHADMAPGESRKCRVAGTLTIHGVARERTVEADVSRTASGWRVQSEFAVRTADHDIDIPKIVFRKIAEEVAVSLQADLEPEEDPGSRE